MKIVIYTDGSCIGNPGPGGWAGLLFIGEREVVLKGGEADTTNNRMEMTAILKALQYLRKNFKDEELQKMKISVHSDSNLIIQTFKQNWKRKKNTDIWEKLDKARAWLDIDWNWVKAHHTNEHNNRVDEIAQKEARKF